MGIPVLILGESGSGKSASLRNFQSEEIGLFNVASKPLPFRNNWKICNTSNYQTIINTLKNPKLLSYAIDDSQYLMAFENFNRYQEGGYVKFTEMAVHFYNLVQTTIQSPPDIITYFLHHTEQINETGKIKAKTFGKMLDQQLTLEGLFSIVLLCKTDGQSHWFETQSDGFTTVKSPMDMFPAQIDNDLKLVDTTIREYYGLTNANKPKSKKAQATSENAA